MKITQEALPHLAEDSTKQLLMPWLRPIEKVLVYTSGYVIVPALVSLSFPPAWHQAFFILQAILLCYTFPFYLVLGVRGYDEQRVGNKEAEVELLGLSGLFVFYFIAATVFREVTWPLWVQSIILVLLLLMSMHARQLYRSGTTG